MVQNRSFPHGVLESDVRMKSASIRRFQQSLTFLLLVLTLVGYPLTALSGEIFGVNNSEYSIAFRIVVITLSAILFITNIVFQNIGRVNFSVLLFLAMYMLRLCYDMAFNQQIDVWLPLQIFAATTFVPAIALSFSEAEAINEGTLAKCVMCLGVIGCVLALALKQLGYAFNPWADLGIESRLGFSRLNPVALGVFCGVTVLASIYTFTRSKSYAWRGLAVFGFGVGCYVVLDSGSRGAFLGTSLAAIWFLTNRLSYAFVAFAVIFGFLQLDLLDLTQIDFFEKIGKTLSLDFSDDQSGLERLHLQEMALTDFFESPVLGKSALIAGAGPGEYPHNFIVDTAMSLGVVGLAVLAAIYFDALFALLKERRRSVSFTTMMFFLAASVSFTSGGIYGASSFFVFLVVLLRKNLNSTAPAKPSRIGLR
jgi:O-antigen ligase